ncbi:winged helix DNA-binding domain-containing protein [Pseudonocardia dioxanivorans]|uniref:winged helix DNA-binding domain-containing protein n=1 Tax=Pseudonocardia dioxanivorans TaxID=240495 RepID=UPI000CD1F020|nr:winged helix DNA-binding domain-containing protein [Pseudonocardia dioxanivorans]
MDKIGVTARRARLVARHRLSAGTRAAGDPAGVVDAARSVLGLHATDPATVHLSAMARTDGAAVADVEHALYTDRTLVRMLGMRRTVWVLDRETAALVQHGCAHTVAATARRRLVGHLAESGVDDAASWLADVEAETLAALHARGEAFAADLTADVPRLRTRIAATGQNATTRVLLQLAADGHIVRGRPRGSWTSTQYRWSPTAAWLGGELTPLPVEEAQAGLARRWIAAFGPAPVSDLRWFTGWTARETTRALAALDTVEVDLDGVPGRVLADDPVTDDEPPAEAVLLPALDPTPMGWQSRDWFLGPHRERLFDRTGNIGPTVWWAGRVVGGWAQRGAGGEVVVRCLEDVGAEAAAAIEAAAHRVATQLAGTRVTPRFRTPLEKELTEG